MSRVEMDQEEYLRNVKTAMAEMVAANAMVSRLPPATGFWVRMSGAEVRDAMLKRLALEPPGETYDMVALLVKHIPEDASYVLPLIETQQLFLPVLQATTAPPTLSALTCAACSGCGIVVGSNGPAPCTACRGSGREPTPA